MAGGDRDVAPNVRLVAVLATGTMRVPVTLATNMLTGTSVMPVPAAQAGLGMTA